MRRTREEFVDLFKYRLAGMVLYMQSQDVLDAGRLGRADAAARRIFDMPAEVEKLLGTMYDALAPVETLKNGPPAAPVAKPQPQVKK